MTNKEKEALDNIVEELNRATGNIFLKEDILWSISSKLPDGEIKDFFRECEEVVEPLLEKLEKDLDGTCPMTPKQEDEMLEKVIEAVNVVKEKISASEVFKQLPEKIKDDYQKCLDTIIEVVSQPVI